MSVNKVVFSGYFGFGNTGDEAILEAACAEMRRQRPDIAISALMDNKDRARELGIEPYPRKKFGAIIKALRNNDVLVSGGGGLIQDSTGWISVLYYLGIITLARLCGRKTIMFCQGFGPVKTRAGKFFARLLLPLAGQALMRDEPSLSELKRFAPHLSAKLTADPALLLEKANDDRINEMLNKAGIGNKKFVVVSLRDWQGFSWEKITAALKSFRETIGEDIAYLFIPFQPDRDTDISQKAAQSLGDCAYIAQGSTKEVLGLISKAEMTVAMRLHALIFSASANVPGVGLSYDPKVKNFCDRCGHAVLENVDIARLTEQLVNTWNGRDNIKAELMRKTEAMRESARQAVAEVLAL